MLTSFDLEIQCEEYFSEKDYNENLKNSEIFDIIYIEDEERKVNKP